MALPSRACTLALLAASASAFVGAPPPRRVVAVAGFLDDMMDKLDGGDSKADAWKDEMMREQQEILKRRQASGGFITEEDEEEIRARYRGPAERTSSLERRRRRGNHRTRSRARAARRRASVSKEDAALKAVQTSTADDNLDAWKAARSSGQIKTATSGLKRDADSSRMGSAGLFAERADAKLPYIDRGYVAEKKTEVNAEGIPVKKAPAGAAAPANPFAGFQNPFEKKEAAPPAPAPAKAPAPAPPNPFAAFFEKPAPAPEPEPEPEPESPLDALAKLNPFAAFGNKDE